MKKIILVDDMAHQGWEQVFSAMYSIDKYLENWDGSLWVRTIYKTNI